MLRIVLKINNILTIIYSKRNEYIRLQILLYAANPKKN